MTATIITKNKTSSGTPSSLAQGELAVNIADKKLFVGGSGGSSVVDLEFDAASATFDGIVQKYKSSADDTILELKTTSPYRNTYIEMGTSTTVMGRIGVTNEQYASPYITAGSSSSTGAGLKFEAAVSSYRVRPCNGYGAIRDNEVDLGFSSSRFADIFATNGTIQTSDRNEKQDITELSDVETRVAVAAKGLLRKFKWRDAVASKGDDARTHFGIIAQDLQDAFTSEGLDAGDYAMFISTTWWEHNGEDFEIQSDAPEGAVEKTRLGVRYPELLAFIIAAI